jgi:hypothetical protein
MIARTLATLLLLAACHKNPPAHMHPSPGGGGGSAVEPGPAPGPGTDPAPGPSPTPAPPAAAGRLGEPCGTGDACGEGACVSYRGIAGARGPEFKSCEIRCDPQGGCAGGRKCTTIADGPGQVCR